MQQELRLLFSLAKLNAVINRRLSGHGLDFNDFMILHALQQAPDHKLRRVDLAHQLGLTASGITRMLLPLEKLGIISRAQDDDDARARYASLTKSGQELLNDAIETMSLRLEDIFPVNCSKQSADCANFISSLTDNLLQPEYQAEAKDNWGDSDAYQQSLTKAQSLTKQELEAIKTDSEELARQIASTMDLGADSPETQELIALHYQALRHFYEPDLEIYRGLGRLYIEDPRFTAYYERFAPGLAQFMNEAIAIFCHNQSRQQ